MTLFQGYKSNVIAEVATVSEAADLVQKLHPKARVTVGISGDLLTACYPGLGGVTYGLRTYVGAQGA